MTLLKQQVKQEWLSLLVWSGVIALLLFYTVYLFKAMSPSLEGLEELIGSMPEGMRAIYGGNVSIRTLPGFLQAFGFGSWIQIPVLIYTGLFAVSIATREIDRRTMEFLLALPVSRWEVIASRWGGMALALGLLHLAQFLAVLLGVLAMGEEPDTANYLLVTLNGWLLMLALGSVMLLVDMFIDDYGRGVGVNLGIALGSFAFHAGTETAEGALRTIRNLLPLSYFEPGVLTGGAVAWGDMGILAAISLIGLGLSIYLFQRKQIAV